MWHEARKQEKSIRNRMVDGAKRAERRRKYYESVRSDPEQFMQIHGRRLKVHMDESIARAAEHQNIL
jgi:arginine/serine-rich splicing factor 16